MDGVDISREAVMKIVTANLPLVVNSPEASQVILTLKALSDRVEDLEAGIRESLEIMK